jgi:hypothetical protein
MEENKPSQIIGNIQLKKKLPQNHPYNLNDKNNCPAPYLKVGQKINFEVFGRKFKIVAGEDEESTIIKEYKEAKDIKEIKEIKEIKMIDEEAKKE